MNQKHFYAATIQNGEVCEYCDKPFQSAQAAINAINKHRTWLSRGAEACALSRARLMKLLRDDNRVTTGGRDG